MISSKTTLFTYKYYNYENQNICISHVWNHTFLFVR